MLTENTLKDAGIATFSEMWRAPRRIENVKTNDAFVHEVV